MEQERRKGKTPRRAGACSSGMNRPKAAAPHGGKRSKEAANPSLTAPRPRAVPPLPSFATISAFALLSPLA